MSEDARERFALLQTPGFIERFILDLTLKPALSSFGLEGLRMIDPTCGSGHFLLGAFARLCDERERRYPGLSRREHARAALAQVYGVDLNPYAIAIARFRLALAYLERAGVRSLVEMGELSLNLAVADSLLQGKRQHQLGEAAKDIAVQRAFGAELFALEDREEAQ